MFYHIIQSIFKLSSGQEKPLFFFFFSLSLSLFVLQGFFKDLMTVNNPHINPQRIEEYVNAAVSNLYTEELGNLSCVSG